MVKASTTKPLSRRPGFTLIELLIVIVILAVLAALLVPAVGRVLTQARVAAVVAEISQLDSAIAKFKADHGVEPPSSITLYETNTAWAADTTGSAALVRQIWPQYDFGTHDINGDGDTADTIGLTLGECLTFFLGGMNGSTTPGTSTANNNVAGNIGPFTGFSKDPTNPFSRGGTREAPLFEFNVSRFTDLDGDGFPEYKDPLPPQTKPYLYYSGYDGQGYAESTEFATNNGGFGLTLAYRQDQILSNNTFWKPSSHQIVSPGYDGAYGYGGAYLATGTSHLPLGSSTTTPPTIPVVPTAAQRVAEADNITNFSGGVLGN